MTESGMSSHGLEKESCKDIKCVHHGKDYSYKGANGKTVVVFGATGKQGGSVICALAQEKKWKIRGVGRSKDDEKFKDLQKHGIEMVEANIVTRQGLDDAFRDATVAFLITPSFDNEIEGKEFEIGTLLVEKAKMNDVKVLVFSTAVNAAAISNKKHRVPQFDEKARIEEYIRMIQTAKQPFEHVIFVAPGFYYQNFFWKGFAPRKENDTYVFSLPHTETLSACDVHDVGYVVSRALEDPERYSNKTIIINSEEAPPAEFVKTFEKITGKKAVLREISLDAFKKSNNIHHGEQLANMFAFMNEHTYFGKDRDKFINARDVFPKLNTWETFLHNVHLNP